MTLAEIENLSAENIKAQSASLVAEAAKQPAAELAQRYIDARYDAKIRDQRLSEQGRTIDALTLGSTSLQATVDELTAAGTKADSQIAELRKQLLAMADDKKSAADSWAAEKSSLQGELSAERAKSERLKTCAMRNHEATSSAAKTLNDALSAHAVDIAEGS